MTQRTTTPQREPKRWPKRVPLSLALAIVWSCSAVPTAIATGARYLAQDRSVVVTVDGNVACWPEAVCAVVPNGPFSEMKDDRALGAAPFFDAALFVLGADTSQTSLVAPHAISARGAISAVSIDDFVGDLSAGTHTTGDTTAESFFAVTFEVDQATAYTLDGTLSGFYHAFFGAIDLRIDLVGPSGAIVEIRCPFGPPPFPPCGPHTEQHTGALAPGLYTLQAVASSSGMYGGLGGPPDTFGQGSYDVSLNLAAPVPGLGLMGAAITCATLIGAWLGVSRRWRSVAARLGATPTRRLRSPPSGPAVP